MRRILIYVMAVLLPVISQAQALPFIAADYSASALSKAGAVATETSSIALSAIGNVAAVPFSDKTADFSAGYTLWQPSSVVSNVIAAGGAFNLKEKLGLALGMTYGLHPGYEIFTESGLSKGLFNPSDVQFNAGLAWRFLPFLSVGTNLGFASSTLAEGTSYGAFVADIYLFSKFSDLKVALGLSDLGSSVVSASEARFSLPSALTLGLGYDKKFAQVHGLDISADADYYLAGKFAVAFGAAYTYDDMLSVKAGYRYGGTSVIPSYASLGLGGRIFGVCLDVAYVLPVGTSPMSNTLSFNIGYSF